MHTLEIRTTSMRNVAIMILTILTSFSNVNDDDDAEDEDDNA